MIFLWIVSNRLFFSVFSFCYLVCCLTVFVLQYIIVSCTVRFSICFVSVCLRCPWKQDDASQYVYPDITTRFWHGSVFWYDARVGSTVSFACANSLTIHVKVQSSIYLDLLPLCRSVTVPHYFLLCSRWTRVTITTTSAVIFLFQNDRFTLFALISGVQWVHTLRCCDGEVTLKFSW